MKKFLVDVPVVLLIWSRPDKQRVQFQVIKEARPSILFLLSDAGRNDEEHSRVIESRKVFEDIDWECQIYKIYMEKNCGLFELEKKIHKLVWEKVDRCIVLEDDDVPSCSFFRFCKEMLDKYENDTRIAGICGYNICNDYSMYQDADFFFSRRYVTWGMAIWRRTYEESFSMSPYLDSKSNVRLFKNVISNNNYYKSAFQQIKTFSQGRLYDGHEASDEFYYMMSACAYNQLFIFPTKNMISNIGINGWHSDEVHKLPRKIQKLYNSTTYELEGEIRYPRYIIPDIMYEKELNRLTMSGNAIRDLHRKVIRAIRSVIFSIPLFKNI